MLRRQESLRNTTDRLLVREVSVRWPTVELRDRKGRKKLVTKTDFQKKKQTNAADHEQVMETADTRIRIFGGLALVIELVRRLQSSPIGWLTDLPGTTAAIQLLLGRGIPHPLRASTQVACVRAKHTVKGRY